MIYLSNPQPRMENSSYASTASGTAAPSVPSGASVPLVAETGEPVPESQLKPAHSNLVPPQVCVSRGFHTFDSSFYSVCELTNEFVQMEKHIEFLDFSNTGDLILGTSSLVTRYWIGQLW